MVWFEIQNKMCHLKKLGSFERKAHFGLPILGQLERCEAPAVAPAHSAPSRVSRRVTGPGRSHWSSTSVRVLTGHVTSGLSFCNSKTVKIRGKMLGHLLSWMSTLLVIVGCVLCTPQASPCRDPLFSPNNVWLPRMYDAPFPNERTRGAARGGRMKKGLRATNEWKRRSRLMEVDDAEASGDLLQTTNPNGHSEGGLHDRRQARCDVTPTPPSDCQAHCLSGEATGVWKEPWPSLRNRTCRF